MLFYFVRKGAIKNDKTVCETIPFKDIKERCRIINSISEKASITVCNGFLIVQYRKGKRVNL